MAKPKFPDGSRTLSLLQKLQWITKPLEILEKQAQIYGDIFTFSFGPSNIPQVIVSNPEGVEKIFTADLKQLDSGKEAGIKLPLLGQHSLIALSGEQHRRQRKLLMPPFHGERMRAYGELIHKITEQVTSQWQIDQTFSVRSSMQAISFEVIIKAVFGLEEGSRYKELKEVLLEWLNPKRPLLQTMILMFPILQKNLGSWSPWGHFLLLRQRMDELIYAEIKERRAKLDSSRTDILSLMMAARDENGEQMTDVELRDELMTLLVAGHETTATSLAWAFYWIHNQPQIRDKLLQELDDLGDNPDSSMILKLPYLNAVCKETLRIYPVTVFAFPRVVKSPLQIGDYHFEPGTILSACIYLTHHREDLYPEPKHFKPERFLERQFSPYEYLPFGGGNRRCLGFAFAEFEMKLVLANVLSRWQLVLADSKPKPVRKGILLAPSDGVRMVVKGKRTQQRVMQTTSTGLTHGN
ncbi:cytochrome P450 [Okeania sp. SIO2B3]|uniref:cytochrome P450 n=1 Tax=Okeania sp. SIO2B3 TaxID=2607784 RepID=UPI0013BFE21F|nr:cytochrome P450 [Okeania sp. SIO2B3]NET45668.1 cytochrome P450 [Okeania sp. SIO2B3]